ncbi:MAG: hypothetical protein ACOYM2_20045, partial [Rectinemataceae bacterium]
GQPMRPVFRDHCAGDFCGLGSSVRHETARLSGLGVDAAGGIPGWMDEGSTGILAKAGEPAAGAGVMETILGEAS